MRVVLAPAHYHLTKRVGSESSWSYNILKYLLGKNIRVKGYFYYLVHNDDFCSENFRYFKRVKHTNNYSIPGACIFSIIYSLFFFIDLIKYKKIDIIHHVLPFNIDITFNLLIILFKNILKSKVVVGPIQSPQSYKKTKVERLNFFYKCIFLLFRPVLNFLSEETLKKADKIVVINHYTKDLLLKRNISPVKIKIIPPGIDLKKFKCVRFKQKQMGTIELISVSNLTKRKGVDLIIKALNEVIKTNKNIRLRIIGDGPQMIPLRRLVNELNLNDYIIFQGYVPNSKIQKFYQKAHIFVSMSRSEPWGQVYLEAMACGLAIITTTTVGSNEIIKDGEFGYLVQQEDYNMLAKKIIYLIENKNFILDFGRSNRKEVEEKYDWNKKIIPQYLEIYNLLEDQKYGT